MEVSRSSSELNNLLLPSSTTKGDSQKNSLDTKLHKVSILRFMHRAKIRTAKAIKFIAKPFHLLGKSILMLAKKLSACVRRKFFSVSNSKLIKDQGFRWGIDAVYSNKKLFGAMQAHASDPKVSQSEWFRFIDSVQKINRINDPSKFQLALIELVHKVINRNSTINIGEKTTEDDFDLNISGQSKKALKEMAKEPITHANLKQKKDNLHKFMVDELNNQNMWTNEIVGNFKKAYE